MHTHIHIYHMYVNRLSKRKGKTTTYEDIYIAIHNNTTSKEVKEELRRDETTTLDLEIHSRKRLWYNSHTHTHTSYYTSHITHVVYDIQY